MTAFPLASRALLTIHPHSTRTAHGQAPTCHKEPMAAPGADRLRPPLRSGREDRQRGASGSDGSSALGASAPARRQRRLGCRWSVELDDDAGATTAFFPGCPALASPLPPSRPPTLPLRDPTARVRPNRESQHRQRAGECRQPASLGDAAQHGRPALAAGTREPDAAAHGSSASDPLRAPPAADRRSANRSPGGHGRRDPRTAASVLDRQPPAGRGSLPVGVPAGLAGVPAGLAEVQAGLAGVPAPCRQVQEAAAGTLPGRSQRAGTTAGTGQPPEPRSSGSDLPECRQRPPASCTSWPGAAVSSRAPRRLWAWRRGQ